MTNDQPPAWFAWLVVAANLLALTDMPYGYYQLLRLLVAVYAGWAALAQLAKDRQLTGWTLVCLAILYNPVFPIHMERETHAAINVLTAAFVGIFAMKSGRQKLT